MSAWLTALPQVIWIKFNGRKISKAKSEPATQRDQNLKEDVFRWTRMWIYSSQHIIRPFEAINCHYIEPMVSHISWFNASFKVNRMCELPFKFIFGIFHFFLCFPSKFCSRSSVESKSFKKCLWILMAINLYGVKSIFLCDIFTQAITIFRTGWLLLSFGAINYLS